MVIIIFTRSDCPSVRETKPSLILRIGSIGLLRSCWICQLFKSYERQDKCHQWSTRARLTVRSIIKIFPHKNLFVLLDFLGCNDHYLPWLRVDEWINLCFLFLRAVYIASLTPVTDELLEYVEIDYEPNGGPCGYYSPAERRIGFGECDGANVHAVACQERGDTMTREF